MSSACEVRVRFFAPPADLRRYFTTFYLVEVDVPDGGAVHDRLHPEWANLRFHSGGVPDARIESGSSLSGTDFAVTGPSSRSVEFAIETTRMWGVGLLPLGWAKFVGAPASLYSNALVDGHRDPAFAGFAPLAGVLFGPAPDPDGELARIVAFFLDLKGLSLPDEERIVAFHAALVDPDSDDVSHLCAKSGLGQRKVERICARVFGFPPRMLLRRQRFMRSLAHFMLDPSLKWIGAIDGQYHDQAQFVRDFRQFMGLSPRQYAAMDKPILGAMVKERMRFAGRAVQALDGPEGGGAPA